MASISIGVIKVNCERDGIDVEKYDISANIMECSGCRRERKRRHQHRVAKPYAAGFSSQVDPCGAELTATVDPASERSAKRSSNSRICVQL